MDITAKICKTRATFIYKTCTRTCMCMHILNQTSNTMSSVHCKVWWHTKLKSEAIPIQVWTRPLGLQIFSTWKWYDCQPYVPTTQEISGTYFWYRLSWPQDHNATRRIWSMKNSSDPIGNQTHDLPAHSAVPQLTVPQHTPDSISRVAVKETTAEQVISVHSLSMVLIVEKFLLPWLSLSTLIVVFYPDWGFSVLFPQL